MSVTELMQLKFWALFSRVYTNLLQKRNTQPLFQGKNIGQLFHHQSLNRLPDILAESCKYQVQDHREPSHTEQNTLPPFNPSTALTELPQSLTARVMI